MKLANWRPTQPPDDEQKARFVQLCEIVTDMEHVHEIYVDTADQTHYSHHYDETGHEEWSWSPTGAFDRTGDLA